MPVDVRKLIFSNKELRLALHSYAKDKSLGVPDSRIENIQVVDGSQSRVIANDAHAAPSSIQVILSYTSSTPGDPVRVHLDQHQTVEALIGLCRSLQIPLPRRSQKFLQRHKDGLSLMLGMDEHDILLARSAHGQ